MDDQACPRCGAQDVRALPKTGDRDDYECRSCGLAFSISGSDCTAFKDGRRGELVIDANGKVWWTTNPAQHGGV